MTRLRQNLNREWRFFRGDCAGAERIDFDDSSWQSIGLPHTFGEPAHVFSPTLPGNAQSELVWQQM